MGAECVLAQFSQKQTTLQASSGVGLFFNPVRAVGDGFDQASRLDIRLDISRNIGGNPSDTGRISLRHSPLNSLAVGILMNPPVGAGERDALTDVVLPMDNADYATMKQDHSNRNPNTPKSHGHRLHC